MQDMYANSNEVIVFQTRSLVGAWKGRGGGGWGKIKMNP